MIKQVTTSLYQQFIADFELQSLQAAAIEPASLLALREKAFEQFKIMGFPSNKVEDWKYVNLQPFLKEGFGLAEGEETMESETEAIAKSAIPKLDAYRLVLINGRYREDLSDTIPDNNVIISPIGGATRFAGFEEHFGKYVSITQHHFAALNTAFFKEGLFIEITAKTTVDKPIHVVQVVTAGNPLFLQPRHLVVVGAGATVSIVESFVTADATAPVFINSVQEVVLMQGAHMQHCYIQTGNTNSNYVQHTQVEQKANSVYDNFKASFPGSSLLRNNLVIALNGRHIESHLNGLYLAGGRQLVDNHTTVDHLQPQCESNELYKGVIKDEAVAVFNGKIFVRKDAQKTNAFQKNNNLMLSTRGTVDSKPQLEIYADDVKCSHGSTIGQFDEDALFYLKARGIGDEKAKALLVHAFAFDVTQKLTLPAVQAHINKLIEKGLADQHR